MKTGKLPIPDFSPLFFHSQSYTYIPFDPMEKNIQHSELPVIRREKYFENEVFPNSILSFSFFFFETEFRSCYPGWSAMA